MQQTARARLGIATLALVNHLRVMFEQRFLEPRCGLEKEHEHGAALGRCGRVTTSLGANDEIAGSAFAFVIDQRPFEYECLLQIFMHMSGNSGTSSFARMVSMPVVGS